LVAAAINRTSTLVARVVPSGVTSRFLDRAQELHLQRARDVGDLVEEEGTAVRGLEDPLVVGDGAGEGPAAMAEELTIEQGVGDGPAVERDEGPLRARPAGMDAAGHELLARAALAGDQDRGHVLGQRFDRLVDVAHRRTLSDDLAEALRALDDLAKTAVLALEIRHPQDLLDRHQQLVGIAGLHEIVPGPELHGLDRRLRAAVPGQDDGRR
jgi:hypothetical protein